MKIFFKTLILVDLLLENLNSFENNLKISMPSKIIVFFKRVGRNWFLIFIIAVIFVFFIEQILAVWLVGIALVLYLLSFLPNIFFKRTLKGKMMEYYMIEEDTIAHKMKKPLRKIRETLFKLSQKQHKKTYLIVYLDNRYIYFHEETVNKFNELYKKGFGEKEILEGMKDYDLQTKSEVKCILNTLKKFNRLSDREISVKEYRDKDRY